MVGVAEPCASLLIGRRVSFHQLARRQQLLCGLVRIVAQQFGEPVSTNKLTHHKMGETTLTWRYYFTELKSCVRCSKLCVGVADVQRTPKRDARKKPATSPIDSAKIE
jgi:hypothetical protein